MIPPTVGDGPQFIRALAQPAQAPNQNGIGIASSEEIAGPGENIAGSSGSLSNVRLAQSPFQTPNTPSGLAVVQVDTITGNPNNASITVVSPPNPTALQEWIVKCTQGAPGGPQAPILLAPDGTSALAVEDPSSPGTYRSNVGQLAALKNGAGTAGRWYYDAPLSTWRLTSTM